VQKVVAMALDRSLSQKTFSNGGACFFASARCHRIQNDSADVVGVIRGVEIVLIDQCQGSPMVANDWRR